jgi:hypothetical protein
LTESRIVDLGETLSQADYFGSVQPPRQTCCRVCAAERDYPFSSEEVVDDIGMRAKAVAQLWTIERLESDVTFAKPSRLFLHSILKLGVSEACTNAQGKPF